MPPLGRKRCVLELILHRICCKDCGHLFWPRLSFMDGNKRYTRAFALTVLDLLKFATIKDVAGYLHVGWDLVKQIHKQKLAQLYQRQQLKDLVYLGIDEFSLRKGHKYMTIFMNIKTGRIIHAVEGRAAEIVAPFLKLLAKKAPNLKAVAVDMSQSYVKALEENLAHVDIVFDRYHIAALANRAIDELRKELQTELDKQGQGYLNERGKAKLQTFLDVNRPLFFMYKMKVVLHYYWLFKKTQRAEEFWSLWCHDAATSGIGPLVRLAKTIGKYKDKILNYFKYRITNAVVEDTNKKIKTLKKQAYGYRDLEYFKLLLYHPHSTGTRLPEEPKIF